ncbi:MAG TPA: ABC transporter permease, partial [Candidatus Baltobacteraceae bacterium]|nr:ABC transporter permease [Candidatus Baltobacteraceae bacterium]
MNYIEEALRIIFSNKVRSLLTVTGLIIGVGAVIAIQVLGKSMAGAVGGAFGDLSDNAFFLSPNPTQADFEQAMITRADLVALSSLPNVAAVIPVTGANDLVQHGHHQARYYVGGDATQPLNNGPLQYGRRIEAQDITAGSNVCVITSKAFQKLFPGGGNPVGQVIYVGVHRYEVIGVLAPPRSGIIPSVFRADVYAPYTTVIRQYLHGDRLGAARVAVIDSSTISTTEVAVIQRLRALHGNT